MPDRVPEDMPGRMPEDMPDRMPEDMPDKKQKCQKVCQIECQDLPVTKRINVMVGITRSFFFCRYFSPAGGRYLRCVVVVLVDYAWLQWMEVGLEYFGITFCVVT